MAEEYHKVGTVLDLYFYLQDSTLGTPVTGKVDADFTKQITKNGTGNQATTGLIITEVSAVNNAGLYMISCASNSFVSATAQYEVKAFLTADTTVVWNQTVRVTSDGTGAGSWGDASFTATASDGRVMVGASPLADALVYISNASGVLYVRTLSGATGLWGPVYFNTNGTYTIAVQKSGYTTTTGTIVVSGSTATGPGADLTIALASTTSTILTSTLQGYLARQMLDASGTQFTTVGLEIINEAAEFISMERQWPYYESYGTVSLQPVYTTGTATLTLGSATVTFSGATLPSWAASAQIFVNNTWKTISTRDSSSQVTLEQAWGNATLTGVAYTLAQIRYALPTDCVRINNFMQGGITANMGEHTSAAYIEAMKDAWGESSTGVRLWAIEKNFLVVYPLPTAAQDINLLYYRKPAQVTTGSDTLDWDATQVVLLRRAIDFVAAGRGATVYGSDGEARANAIRAAKAAYEEALDKAWTWDRTAANPSTSQAWAIDTLRGTVT